MMEVLSGWATPVAAWLLTYIVHSTILIALAYLVARRLDGRPAALDRLWKIALVGGVLTATLQTAAGVSPWGGRLGLRPHQAQASVAPAAAAPSPGEQSLAPLANQHDLAAIQPAAPDVGEVDRAAGPEPARSRSGRGGRHAVGASVPGGWRACAGGPAPRR